MQINPDLAGLTTARAKELLAGDIEGYRLPLMELIERQAAEVERLKRGLRDLYKSECPDSLEQEAWAEFSLELQRKAMALLLSTSAQTKEEGDKEKQNLAMWRAEARFAHDALDGVKAALRWLLARCPTDSRYAPMHLQSHLDEARRQSTSSAQQEESK